MRTHEGKFIGRESFDDDSEEHIHIARDEKGKKWVSDKVSSEALKNQPVKAEESDLDFDEAEAWNQLETLFDAFGSLSANERKKILNDIKTAGNSLSSRLGAAKIWNLRISERQKSHNAAQFEHTEQISPKSSAETEEIATAYDELAELFDEVPKARRYVHGANYFQMDKAKAHKGLRATYDRSGVDEKTNQWAKHLPTAPLDKVLDFRDTPPPQSHGKHGRKRDKKFLHDQRQLRKQKQLRKSAEASV